MSTIAPEQMPIHDGMVTTRSLMPIISDAFKDYQPFAEYLGRMLRDMMRGDRDRMTDRIGEALFHRRLHGPNHVTSKKFRARCWGGKPRNRYPNEYGRNQERCAILDQIRQIMNFANPMAEDPLLVRFANHMKRCRGQPWLDTGLTNYIKTRIRQVPDESTDDDSDDEY